MRTEAQIPCLPTSARRLDLYQVTLELIALCRPFAPRLKRFNRRLGAQLTESLASRCRTWPRPCGARAETGHTC
jgi:hypothetical protein